jgi:hypothetical protein
LYSFILYLIKKVKKCKLIFISFVKLFDKTYKKQVITMFINYFQHIFINSPIQLIFTISFAIKIAHVSLYYSGLVYKQISTF